MQAVILIGIPGAGKTSFYREKFFDTHVRISLDMLGTREREQLLVAACLKGGQPFVVDNTNVLVEDRVVYLRAAKASGFKTIGYFFRPEVRASIARNNKRADKKPVPVPAILRANKRLQPPSGHESFDELFTVTLDRENRFEVVAGVSVE